MFRTGFHFTAETFPIDRAIFDNAVRPGQGLGNGLNRGLGGFILFISCARSRSFSHRPLSAHRSHDGLQRGRHFFGALGRSRLPDIFLFADVGTLPARIKNYN